MDRDSVERLVLTAEDLGEDLGVLADMVVLGEADGRDKLRLRDTVHAVRRVVCQLKKEVRKQYE